MEKEIVFTERQKFTQWWVWVILLGVNVIFFFGFFNRVIGDKPFEGEPMGYVGFIATLVLILSLTTLFFVFRLETVIKKEGVYVRFFPFHIKFRHYAWAEIHKSYVRQYAPLGEFGGWGIRYARKGRALNVSGNMGLQLEFTNGKRLLIGTKKPDELNEALRGIGQARE